MGVSKVIYNGDTVIDISTDTVTEDTVEEGITFHGADGEAKIGTAPKKIPTFNLTALGLPEVSMDGTSTSVETDTTEIISALEKGAVRFVFVSSEFGEVSVIPCVTNTDSQWVCTGVFDVEGGSAPTSVTVRLIDGRIYAYIGGEVEERITALEEAMAELLYEPMTISKFANNVNTAEIGSTITAVTLSWALNKIAESVTLDGETQATDKSGSKALTGQSITSNKSWTLVATDERGAKATKTTSISFLNGVYYGVGTVFNATSCTKTLSNTKGRTFTVNAGEGEYIWYAVPKRLGTCAFNVGGFDGGFTLSSTESITNTSGYSEEYYIYRSSNDSLGSTTVVVS